MISSLLMACSLTGVLCFLHSMGFITSYATSNNKSKTSRNTTSNNATPQRKCNNHLLVSATIIVIIMDRGCSSPALVNGCFEGCIDVCSLLVLCFGASETTVMLFQRWFTHSSSRFFLYITLFVAVLSAHFLKNFISILVSASLNELQVILTVTLCCLPSV